MMYQTNIETKDTNGHTQEKTNKDNNGQTPEITNKDNNGPT